MGLTTAAQQILRRAGAHARPGTLPEPLWELIDRYRADLERQAQRILGSRADAEDVVQETYREALRQMGTLSQVRSIGSWLRTINRANALSRLQARKTVAKRARDDQHRSRSVTTGGFSTLELCDQLKHAVDALTEEQRAVVQLHFYEELPSHEVAKRLKISTRTVRRLLYTASQRLHAILARTPESRR